MHRLALAVGLLAAPGLAAAQQAAPPADASTPDLAGLAAGWLDVAYVEAAPGLSAGDRVTPGQPIDVPAAGCLRLVAAELAALTLCGPARARVEPAGTGLVTVQVDAGRGLLYADAPGGAIRVAGRALALAGGVAAFDAGAERVAWLLSGRGWLDGIELQPLPSESPADLASPSLCAPPRPAISVRLGEPSALVASAEAERQGREEQAASSEGSAESGATCVDSADSSSASDPSQGGDGGVDPDARRGAGRVRILVRVPWRSR